LLLLPPGAVQIALWSMAEICSNSSAQPAVLTAIPAGDVQVSVKFNMNNVRELISNGKRRVYFWSQQVGSERARKEGARRERARSASTRSEIQKRAFEERVSKRG
jgi:hypothetical protein